MNAVNRIQSAEPEWITLCQEGDLVPFSGVVAWHQGRQVALFYLPGQSTELYAVDNRDPRSGAQVIGRGLIGDLSGEPVVAAPLYKQHFSLRDGRCLEDPAQMLSTWPVRLRQGRVEIAS